MEWDLGFGGVALLLGIALAFGVGAQLVMWKITPHWYWLLVTAVYFVSGLLISEVWFGWATQEELQPNIDGLSFDEAVWFSFLIGLAFMFATWLLGRRIRGRPPEERQIGTGPRPGATAG